jgi:hypothetical protein
MTAIVGAIVALSFLSVGRATNVEEFGPLMPNTPALAAFQQWHKAVVAGDFEAYLRLSTEIEGIGPETRKAEFQEHRRAVPLQIKVTPPKTLPTGAIEFHAAGCRDDIRHIALIIVTMRTGMPRVISTGWAPPWNQTARDCPV